MKWIGLISILCLSLTAFGNSEIEGTKLEDKVEKPLKHVQKKLGKKNRIHLISVQKKHKGTNYQGLKKLLNLKDSEYRICKVRTRRKALGKFENELGKKNTMARIYFSKVMRQIPTGSSTRYCYSRSKLGDSSMIHILDEDGHLWGFQLASKAYMDKHHQGEHGDEDKNDEDNKNPPKEDPTTKIQVSPPYAQGESQGLKWEVRFNHLSGEKNKSHQDFVCNHPGRKPGAWCQYEDIQEGSRRSGVEDKLKSIIFNPEIKSIRMAYFSFSNKRVRRDLCTAANDPKRDLNVEVYLDEGYWSHIDNDWRKANIKKLATCAPEKIKVFRRGKGPFGTPGAHLQHTKVFLATPFKNPIPFAQRKKGEVDEMQRNGRIYFTSSSANMSTNGTALHFENWLFFNDVATSHLAQSQLCLFQAFANARENVDSREQFANDYANCERMIRAKKRKDIKFFAVPETMSYDGSSAYKSMVKMLDNAKDEVLVAIHRFLSPTVVNNFTRAAYRKSAADPKKRVSLRVIFDDDNLRVGKVNGGDILDMSPWDSITERTLRSMTTEGYKRDGFRVQVRYMETQAGNFLHLHHNKFVVVDNEVLFQGAGNFTGAALNVHGHGNYEQFYTIRIPEIVTAYHSAWGELAMMASEYKDHPVSSHKDREIVGGNRPRFADE